MALTAAQATYNAAIDTALAALETMVEAQAVLDRIPFVAIETLKGDASDTQFGSDATVVFNGAGEKYWVQLPKVTNPGDIPLRLGRHPMFFKVTNSAGDLT
jgi:hypothetical protein